MRNLSRCRAEGVVSRQLIERPRTVRTCGASYCSRHSRRMEAGEPRLRLFGAAFRGCPPYAIYIHPECEDNKS